MGDKGIFRLNMQYYGIKCRFTGFSTQIWFLHETQKYFAFTHFRIVLIVKPKVNDTFWNAIRKFPFFHTGKDIS